jgi:hypothetical protein
MQVIPSDAVSVEEGIMGKCSKSHILMTLGIDE